MMTAAWVLRWEQAFDAGSVHCGGKGYHLARLARYGFPVPRGGVLVAEVYRDLMQTAPLKALAENLAGLQATEVLDTRVHEQLGQLQERLMATHLPEAVQVALQHFLQEHELLHTPLAVRSSAVSEDGPHASFAGIHQSVLSVQGIEAVHEAIVRCFASLWTLQAVAYRRRMGFADSDVLCAVVFCAMVRTPGAAEPQSAGVAFSCDPRTGQRDLIVINAAAGLGEKVVSGTVEPDQVVLRNVRGTMQVLERQTRGTPVLTPAHEQELALHVWRIHWSLGHGDTPQDIEWAHDGTQFWFLQARPVTRLPHYTFAGVKHLPVIWSTANIKDAVPGVISTCAWSLIQEIIDAVLYAGPRYVGYDVPAGLQTLKRLDGRLYFDLTAMQWCFYDLAGIMPERTIAAIGGHQPVIPVPAGDPLAGSEGQRRRRVQWKFFPLLLTFRRRLARALQEHHAAVRALAAQPWEELDNAALLQSIRQLAALHERIDTMAGLSNGYASAFMDLLDMQLRALAGERAPALFGGLLAGSGAVTSAEQGYRIADLARAAQQEPEVRQWLQSRALAQTWEQLPAHSLFRRELGRFLHEFGHRAVYEADVMQPRWVDDPTYILEQVRRLLEHPPERDARQVAREVSARAWQEITRLTWWRRPLLKWLVRRTQHGFAAREAGKSGLVASMWPTHHLVLEIGRRLVAAGHLHQREQAFHLSKAELSCFVHGVWDGQGAAALAQDRAAQRAAWLMCTPPDVIIEGDNTAGLALAAPCPAFDGQIWRGIGVSAGQATATARLVEHPHEGHRLGPGEILVAPSTDPGWTPLFLRASAIVMETGGYLSHGAIVAREYGLPAVVNIPGIVQQLIDGEVLTVDGDAALVRRLAGP